MPKHQSSFRKGNSTETLLLWLVYDIYNAVDAGRVTLLDVGVAFDTVDHTSTHPTACRPVTWLDTLLPWTFLEWRNMRVEIGSDMSAWVCFQMMRRFTRPATYLTHSVTFWGFWRWLLAFNPGCVLQSVWLNSGKTQFVWFRPQDRLSDIHKTVILTSFRNWALLHVVRNLSDLLDEGKTMSDYVNSLCSSCLYELRQIRVIQRDLSHDAVVTLVHSYILTRLDYCYSVLVGLQHFHIHQFQSILNSTAWVWPT